MWASVPVWTAWKISPPLGFDPRIVQPVAILCNDYAIALYAAAQVLRGRRKLHIDDLRDWFSGSNNLRVTKSAVGNGWACLHRLEIRETQIGFWKSCRTGPLGRPWRRYEVSIKSYVK